MTPLHQLKPAAGSHQRRKRVGRGDGSNRGSYSGRGSKGQQQTGKVPFLFEGGQLRIVKRLPHMRGFTNRFRVEYSALNVESLNSFEDGATVTIDDLYATRLVRRRGSLVKLLAGGDLEKKVDVTVHACSASALAKVEAAGGTVTVVGEIKTNSDEQPETSEVATEEAAAGVNAEDESDGN